MRTLSYTEISTALTCQAQHAFRYTGRLTGGKTLKAKGIKPILSNGRAWGAMMAAWHANAANGNTLLADLEASIACHDSLSADFARMEEFGLVMAGVMDRRLEIEHNLAATFQHYKTLTEPLPNLTKIEEEILVPVPSRTLSGRPSSRYRFQCFLDGFTVDPSTGYEWLVEYKFRGTLSSHETLELNRQHLWYAWARQRQTGRPIVGIIIDERLDYPPNPVKIVRTKRKSEGINGRTVSHAVDQRCTPEAYLAACQEFECEPNPETFEALRARAWQRRHRLPFRPSELQEAGRELVSAAETIRDLDGGRYPVRNARPAICGSCDFKRICKNPGDDLYVDLLFERTTPKRLRPSRLLPTAEDDGAAGGSTSPPASPVTEGDTVNVPEVEEVVF